VRTTLTLDDDVAAKLQAESRSSGRSFKEVVNQYLRLGLLQRKATRGREPFKIEPRDLGALKPGVSLDNISDLLESLEGPEHR
jgi:hypothetical protein